MKKQGFTLVELLGVIVVLSIIVLITVPTIIGIIDKSRKGALQNSGYGLVEAGTLYYAHYQNFKTIRFDIKNNNITTKDGKDLTYKGNIKEGTVLINNKGQVVICINDGKYAAYKNFKDNKVTIVNNRTCTIPENSNIVYLDNEATIDINLEDLVAEMNQMKQELKDLKEEKASQSDVTTSINNLKTTHNTDMNSMNTRLDSLTTSLTNMDISNKIHKINDDYHGFTSSSEITYTGISYTIPANSYFCLTAQARWLNSPPRIISINYSNSSWNLINSANSSTENLPTLSTTWCDKTSEEFTYYIWASYINSASNAISLSGFYITM